MEPYKITTTAQNLHAIAFSPDGKKLITGSSLGNVCLWNLNGICIRTIKIIDSICSIAMSRDGNTIAVGLSKNIILLNMNDENSQICLCDGYFHTVAFSPDSKTIASGRWCAIKLWDLAGNCIQTIKHEHHPVSIAFNSDGTIIASASYNGIVMLWDLAGNCLYNINLNCRIYSIAFNANALFILETYKGIIKIRNLSGECVQTVHDVPNTQAIAFSPDHLILISASNGWVKFWRTPEFVRWQKITFLLGLKDKTSLVGRATKEWLYDRNVIREILKYL